MSRSPSQPPSLHTVAVVIPVLDERENLRRLLPVLLDMRLGQIIVADNGSTDGSQAVADAFQVTLTHQPLRGYGATCLTGLGALGDHIEVVVFLDADLADDPARLPRLVQPILTGRGEFVLGARVSRLREFGAMNPVQVFGSVLSTFLIWVGWGFRYRLGDLAPFRAIQRQALERIDMRDRAFGWTLEMQVRAVEEDLRIIEIPTPYRRREGRSKISGTVSGIIHAGYGIFSTCARLWWTRRDREKRRYRI